MNQTYWDEPDVACMPCRGRGWILQEDTSGMPREQVPCPYCKGRQNSLWVSERRSRAQVRSQVHRRLWWLLGIVILVHLAVPMPSLLYAAVWLPWIALRIWAPRWLLWPRGYLLPQIRRPRHAPGFTDQREVNALTMFGAAVGLKSAWDSHRRRP